MRIIVVEDDRNIRESICKAVSKENYEAYAISSAKEARDYFRSPLWHTDLVIMDVSLGDGNGFFLMQDEIMDKKIPVIFLTVRDDEEDVLKGFSLGAEDYIRKPFSMRELMARIKRILINREKSSEVWAGDICIDISDKTVAKGGKEVDLSPIERRLVMVLAQSSGKVISREVLLDYIWEWTGNDVDDHTLTVYMNRLRAKVGDGAFETIRGMGYRLRGNGG